MKRIHLFEFTDLPWYPPTFRRIQTDYLHFAATLGMNYKNLIPLFAKAMHHAKTTEIVDLCSGGTGPWVRLQELFRQAGLPVSVKLTDKYPNPQALQEWSETLREGIEYLAEPVDAMKVPGHLKGMRTLFEGFHHFKPEQAKSILRDAVEKEAAIGIFDGSLKLSLGLLPMILGPLMVLISYPLVTPFITPRTLSRFFWTYLVPIVPLVTCWDGVVSFMRTYSIQDLKELTESLQSEDYIWETGQAPTGIPLLEFTYLIGYPAEK